MPGPSDKPHVTTPQNPYGPQAQPAQPYSSIPQTGPQGPRPRHSAPAPQASWNSGPQQPYQAPMSTGYPQQGGVTGFAPRDYPAQSSGAPAGLPQQGAAQRSGEYGLPQYPGNGQPPQAPRNGFGTTALVLGILG